MEINPSLARLRILEQVDGVQMQREAAPDDELAGCPGCPYFWTCPVPHRAENVEAPAEVDPADVADQLPARTAYRPRDADDIGWTDEWVEVEEPLTDVDATAHGGVDDGAERPAADRPATGADGASRGRRRAGRWGFLRRSR